MTTANWSEGYATGTGYTHGYYPELNPRHAAFALLLQGLEGPPPGPCCELGFGQGLSLAFHAAGNPARRWWGNDFMPEQAAQADTLIRAAGVDAVISDESFEAFFARTDLPRFAFVGLHGIWSWISQANRARITEFLSRQLLPGAVVYVSYNTLPGWASFLPLRDLMRQHLLRSSPAGTSEVRKIRDALDFVRRLLAAEPQVAVDSPYLLKRMGEWLADPPQYISHELLNEDWHPMSFVQVASEFGAARLSYACSADMHARLTGIHLTPEHQAFLAGIEDPALRESAMDVFTARRFRREYWVRGPLPLARAEVSRRLQAQRLVLAKPAVELGTLVVNGPRGSSTAAPEHLALVLGTLQDANGPLEIGRILQAAAARGFDANVIVELMASLLGGRAVLLAGEASEVEAARPAAARLNAHLVAPHARRAEIVNLLSPVTGGGVAASPVVQMILCARAAAPTHPEQWPGLVWDAMQAEGQTMMSGDQPVASRAAAQSTLEPMVQLLTSQTLPVLKRLGVVE